MKEFAIGTLQRLVNNKHTSGAAVAYGIAWFGSPIAKIWFPGHAAQIDETADIIRKAAFMYGMLMAGDAAQSVSKTDAETTFVKKDEKQP